MVRLPLYDSVGNALVGFRFAAESELAVLDDRIPMPLSLIVVTFAGRVLMVFDRWRKQWELPGGMLASGETARQAAVRELAEETGISDNGPGLHRCCRIRTATAHPPGVCGGLSDRASG
jgi:8-oxo-dGTP diphosphatase